MKEVKLIECPRDAMQGVVPFISTEDKVRYINTLLKVGFDTIDFGSFVSPKAIPQMRDTKNVLKALDIENSKSKLLAIVANMRGALEASTFDEISLLGYPFSISETFQIRNTNASITESLERVDLIQEICFLRKKDLLIYISMGFGNPYGDPWSVDIAEEWVEKMHAMGVKYIMLSDTIGVSSPESISYMFSNLIPRFPDMEIGAHLHTTPSTWKEKVHAAYESGCRRFDGAIKGYGGCPMAKDELTGNMPTERLVEYFSDFLNLEINFQEFNKAMNLTDEVFPTH